MDIGIHHRVTAHSAQSLAWSNVWASSLWQGVYTNAKVSIPMSSWCSQHSSSHWYSEIEMLHLMSPHP